jgi:hypothetical protein
MTESKSGNDRLWSILVLIATIGTIIFNGLASTGRVGGVTPAEISDKYPTPITPAGYAFAIWSLIYLGLAAFSIYQLLPKNLDKFRRIRVLYIVTAILNCSWIYFWHQGQIALCLAIIAGFAFTLFLINRDLQSYSGLSDYWAAKAPFGIYFGWVTAATLVNFAISLKYFNVDLSASAWTWTAVGLIALAATLGVLIRYRLSNYLYPLAIAWALTAIGVKQSGQTLVVVATALGTIACLIAALSFVVNLPSTDTPRT